MDEDVLRTAGVIPVSPRRGYVDDFELRIGRRATLVSRANERAYGLIYSMSHRDIDKLYGQPGLEDYRPEAVLVNKLEGGSCVALCFNLLVEAVDDEKNTAYAEKLTIALKKFEFPPEYIGRIG